MTLGELKVKLAALPPEAGDLEIIVRCSWDGDEPNGNCFDLGGIGIEDNHATGEDFVVFDCDQPDPADEPPAQPEN